jgi:hypothetical protein
MTRSTQDGDDEDSYKQASAHAPQRMTREHVDPFMS